MERNRGVSVLSANDADTKTGKNSREMLTTEKQENEKAQTDKAKDEDDDDDDEEDLLDSFFPFDPYRLPGSRLFMDGIFLEWEDSDHQEEEEEEDDDDDDDEQDEDQDENDNKSVGMQLDGEDEGETLMLRKTLAAVGVMRVDEDDGRGPRR